MDRTAHRGNCASKAPHERRVELDLVGVHLHDRARLYVQGRSGQASGRPRRQCPYGAYASLGFGVSVSTPAPRARAVSETGYTIVPSSRRAPVIRITHGSPPVPTKVWRVPGGQWTKSQARRGRSCSSISSKHSPASTRKSSWLDSAWYMPVGFPGSRTASV